MKSWYCVKRNNRYLIEGEVLLTWRRHVFFALKKFKCGSDHTDQLKKNIVGAKSW
jgi:hypothetical protein